MKKMLKLLGIILAVPILLLVLLFVLASFKPMAPPNYTQEIISGGAIEKKYLRKGGHSVKMQKLDGSEITKKFYLYYPEELESDDRQYPVVVMLNGTGVLPKRYPAVFKHLASWGFVVIGNDDNSAGFGISADETIDLIKEVNADKGSMFYGKLDEARIGIVGHSQGGAGVLTALSAVRYKDIYQTAVALSPTHEEMAHELGWMYDLEQITVPILLLAGTEGDFETQAVIPLEKMKDMYEKISSSSKVMARRSGAEHGEMLYAANGCTTAWFMWQLQGDSYAAEAFEMNGELESNPLYQDTNLS